MIKGLSAVSIWSADLNNLLPFYRDRLGLPVAIESPRLVLLGPPGGPPVGLGTHRDVRGRNADPARHMIGLATDDLAGDRRRLEAAGSSSSRIRPTTTRCRSRPAGTRRATSSGSSSGVRDRVSAR